MALKTTKKPENKQTGEIKIDSLEVTRAHALNDEHGTIMFDMIVNGVIIYGMSYRVLIKKETKEEFVKIGFPSRKGKDDKYYNNVYFKVTDEIIGLIEKGLEAKGVGSAE